MKERILKAARSNSKLKQVLHYLLFRRKPYQSNVRWYVWLITTFPRYFRRGISRSTRLDLVPFNRFVLGKRSKLEKNVTINNGMGDVIIGDDVQIGIGTVIIGKVTMKNFCGISQYVRIIGMHHGLDPVAPHHELPCTTSPVHLGEDVFLGTGTVVMGKKDGTPLILGDYCRVGANSVVTTDLPPYSIAVGNPARVVKTWDFDLKKWVSIAGVKELVA